MLYIILKNILIIAIIVGTSIVNKSKDLLIYALNLEKDNNSITDTEKMLLRYILVNAKIYITEKRTQLDIIISTIAYLIKAKKYDYISNNNLIFVTMQTNF